MKMTFLDLFLICTFKDPKLAEKWTNLAENPKKKVNSAEFMEFAFSSSKDKLHPCKTVYIIYFITTLDIKSYFNVSTYPQVAGPYVIFDSRTDFFFFVNVGSLNCGRRARVWNNGKNLLFGNHLQSVFGRSQII